MNEILARIDAKKKQLDAARPLPPELVKNLDEWLSIAFTYTSNAIEGNTLSHAETALVVEKGITIGGKSVREHLEAINHAKAIDFIKTLVTKKRSDLGLDDIFAIHRIVDDTEPGPRFSPGRRHEFLDVLSDRPHPGSLSVEAPGAKTGSRDPVDDF